jgi:hypothetical protein
MNEAVEKFVKEVLELPETKKDAQMVNAIAALIEATRETVPTATAIGFMSYE